MLKEERWKGKDKVKKRRRRGLRRGRKTEK